MKGKFKTIEEAEDHFGLTVERYVGGPCSSTDSKGKTKPCNKTLTIEEAETVERYVTCKYILVHNC